MENKAYDFLSVKLSAHKTPVFKEEKNKEWIVYGADKESGYYNNYPAYLLYLYDRSSKHKAFINGAVHYIAGNGIGYDDNGLSLEDKAVVDSFLNKENEDGETLEDVIKKCTLDKVLFGGFYLEILWNKAGTSFDVLHIPFNNIRKSKDGKGWFYSKDWSKSKQTAEDTGLEFIPSFNAEKPQARQLYAYKSYRPNAEEYPLPDYTPVYAEIDVELSNYRLNAIKSGFNAGTIISFNNGTPTEEERGVLETKLKEKFTGTDQANSLLINFNRSKESAPSIEHLAPQNVDTQLDALNKETTQDLIITHHITNPILVGVKTEGQLGGRAETIDSFELYKNGVIIPIQREIERVFNRLLSYKGFTNRIFLNEVQPLEEQIPAEKKWEVMTTNEKREVSGLEPIEEEVKPVVSKVVHRFGEDECCSHEFSDDYFAEVDNIVEVFRQYGEDADNYEEINKKYIFNEVTADDIFADEVKNYNFDILEGDVKLLYRNIIDLLSKDPLMDNKSIAEALKTNENRVKIAVDRLIKDGAIASKADSRMPSKDAIKILEEQKSSVANLRIMYKYDWRPGVRPDKRNSREFCVKMLNANKIYSREQIEQISKIVDWDVWSQRGGWWTRKGGEIVTPYCRHVWTQVVVRKKN